MKEVYHDVNLKLKKEQQSNQQFKEYLDLANEKLLTERDSHTKEVEEMLRDIEQLKLAKVEKGIKNI